MFHIYLYLGSKVQFTVCGYVNLSRLNNNILMFDYQFKFIILTEPHKEVIITHLTLFVPVLFIYIQS